MQVSDLMKDLEKGDRTIEHLRTPRKDEIPQVSGALSMGEQWFANQRLTNPPGAISRFGFGVNVMSAGL